MRSNPGRERRLFHAHADTVTAARHVVPALLVGVLFMVLASLIHAPQALAQEISARAELSASSITRDESVTLTITAIGMDEELDPSSLDKDFDVISRSSSRQTSLIINSSNEAENTSVVTWVLELLPKGEGVFTVPAVKVGDYSTQLLSLTVNATPDGAQRDVYVETSVDTEQPWVQSQVVMSVRVFEGVDILDGALNNPEADDLHVERLGEDTVSQQMVNGRQYRVIERRFALFPQRSGSMTIEPITLSVTVPVQSGQSRSFFAPSRRLTRRSDSIRLNVQARPSGGSGWWLPARDLSLANEWQGNPEAAEVGQPLTRTLVIRADGVLNSQLPEINIPAVEGMSVYAEEPRLDMLPTAQGLISEQRINWALIPQRSGTLTMPAVSVEWFNTATGQPQISTLPEQSITVLAAGAVDSSGSSAAPAVLPSASPGVGTSVTPLSTTDLPPAGDLQNQPSDRLITPATQQLPVSSIQQMGQLHDRVNSWRQLAFLGLALWLLTLPVVWVFYRRAAKSAGASVRLRKVSSASTKASKLTNSLFEQLSPMSPLDRACKEGNFPAIKQALLEWSAQQWSNDPPGTLDELHSRMPDGAARDKIRQLQGALYGKAIGADTVVALGSRLQDLPVDLKTMMRQGGVLNANQPLRDNGGTNGYTSESDGRRLPDL